MRRCPSCGAKLRRFADSCHVCGTPLRVPRPPLWRRSGFIAFAAIVAGLLVVGGFILVEWIETAENVHVETISPGDHVVGTIGPSSTMGSADKPYVDYDLVVPRSGTYEIAVKSNDPSLFDPLTSLLLHDEMIAEGNDDNKSGNAVLREELQPGRYVVRVTREEMGSMDTNANFSLTVKNVAASVASS